MQQIEDFKQKAEEIKNQFNQDLISLRTDRAVPELVENILVDYYGAKTPLKQVGSISTPDSRTIVIQPWDKASLNDIEKAVNAQGAGLTAQADEDAVRVKIPLLNQERREQIVRQIGQKTENARIAVRRIRDNTREQVKNITAEDDKFKGLKELDEANEEINKKIEEIKNNKEKQVME